MRRCLLFFSCTFRSSWGFVGVSQLIGSSFPLAFRWLPKESLCCRLNPPSFPTAQTKPFRTAGHEFAQKKINIKRIKPLERPKISQNHQPKLLVFFKNPQQLQNPIDASWLLFTSHTPSQQITKNLGQLRYFPKEKIWGVEHGLAFLSENTSKECCLLLKKKN